MRNKNMRYPGTLKYCKACSIFLLSAAMVLLCSYRRSAVSRMPSRDQQISVPLGGNAWRSTPGRSGGRLSNRGIVDWTDPQVEFTAYVRFAKTGTVKVWLHLNVPEGKSSLRVTVLNHARNITVEGSDQKDDHYAGEWNIKDTGYVAFHIKGNEKTGDVFADIESLKLSGSAVNERTAFVKNNEGNFFLWGRRGPSVHLNYIMPGNVHGEWFYNEITVPAGNDVVGSYFMADGFGEGYFGMQVNSPAVRHILFSVWSPYKTDDPGEIPEDKKILLLKKGADVHGGEFGGEGSGGQSYMNYLWKTGVTYKFLLHVRPDGQDHTVYTAYFYAPEKGKWLLIASFRRPHTNTWITHPYSFLENFSPAQGDIRRMGLYGNQWICTDQGKWIELNKARFTTDNTGNKGYRMDYSGGIRKNKFYLQNCGFFSDYSRANRLLERPSNGKEPDIDFTKLP